MTRIFIYEYHGWRNIGAEARLLALIENLRSRLDNVVFEVSSFGGPQLRCIRENEPGVRIRAINPALPRRGAASRRLTDSRGEVTQPDAAGLRGWLMRTLPQAGHGRWVSAMITPESPGDLPAGQPAVRWS